MKAKIEIETDNVEKIIEALDEIMYRIEENEDIMGFYVDLEVQYCFEINI